MWEGSYGKEPFDLRLTLLRVIRRLHLIIAVTLAGTLVFGGGYYVKNVLLRSEPVYSAESTCRIEYAVSEEKDVSTVHINEMTWNTYVDTKLFQDEVRRYLPEDSRYTDDELAEAIDAVVASNLKVLTIVTTTGSPEESVAIAAAAEKALTQDFPGEISEISSAVIIDPAREAQEVYPDVRPLRAFVLSAVLSFFFILTAVLLKELGDDSIWLPVTLERRYGLKTLGTAKSPDFAENLSYLFQGREKVAVCPVQEHTDPAQVLSELRKAYPDIALLKEEYGWYPSPSPILCPESCKTLRHAGGILLVAEAGSHVGKQFEYVTEYLHRQDCRITAVLLWNADERLLKQYYRLGKKA